jgi:flagellar biosynthetic protein FlhB
MAEHDDREQRTEDATPRRRDEAREKGQVPYSGELVAAVGLVGGATVLGLGGGALVRAAAGEIERGVGVLATLGTTELTVRESAELLSESIGGVAWALGVDVFPSVILCALTGFAQAGVRLAPKAIEADPAKIDPIKGMGRLFGMRAVVRAALSFLKVVLVCTAAGTLAWMHVDEIAGLGTSELGPQLAAMGVVALRTAVAALSVILVLAALDALFQRLQHERDLRMTRAEVKEEHRLSEGDPHVRARIRAVQRELAMRRMMSDVPRATVVITNPTHYAVALRYDKERGGAPVVVAKGADHLAQRIKELARAAGVRCHEDVALARGLYSRSTVGQEIPAELYAAVAAVLATIYRMQEART